MIHRLPTDGVVRRADRRMDDTDKLVDDACAVLDDVTTRYRELTDKIESDDSGVVLSELEDDESLVAHLNVAHRQALAACRR